MTNDLVPFYEDGDELPCVVTAAVTGCKAVQITAARTSGPGLSSTSEGSRYQVGHPNASGAAGAGKAVLGIASWDTALNGPVTVKRGSVLPVFCSANITHGQEVEVAADGSVIPLNTGKAIGMALNDATNGNLAEILMYM